jgi:WD40 repeat protein
MTARFDAAGSRLVTMTQQSLLQVWSMATGQLLVTIADHRDQFRTFDLDPRGDWLVTTSWHGNSKLWRLGDGKMIANLGGTNRRTQDVSISRDGGRASAMMSDGALENWPLFAGIDQAIGQARRQIGQCLSGSERDALGLSPEQPKWCRDNAG